MDNEHTWFSLDRKSVNLYDKIEKSGNRTKPVNMDVMLDRGLLSGSQGHNVSKWGETGFRREDMKDKSGFNGLEGSKIGYSDRLERL